jgi:hypothetical protein
MSGLLAGMMWSVRTSKSHSILTWSFSVTVSGLCKHACVALSKFCFSPLQVVRLCQLEPSLDALYILQSALLDVCRLVGWLCVSLC